MDFISSNHINNKEDIFDGSLSFSFDVPERILICFDLCVENEAISQVQIQSALRTFVKGKLEINKAHSIALIGLDNDKIVVLSRLTTNLNVLLKCINALSFQGPRTEPFNLNLLYSEINEFIDIEKLELIPQYIYRTIMIVNKSIGYTHHPFSIPKICKNSFFIDFIQISQSEDTEDSQENISDQLRKLWVLRPSSFIFVLSSLEVDLKKACIQLLAHPLQRPPQKMVNLNCNHIIEQAKAKQNKLCN